MIRMLVAAACLIARTMTATVGGHICGGAAAGEKACRKSNACHQLGAEAEDKVCPARKDVVDRAISLVEDFKYSSAFADLNTAGEV